MRLPVREIGTTRRCHALFGSPASGDEAIHAVVIFLALFAALLWPVHADAESRTGTSSARSSLDFRIVIPAIIRVTTIAQPDRLRVTDGDISRGYVDLEAGSSVKMTTNSRLGYLLTAIFDQQLLAGVEVRAAGRSLNATSGSGSLQMTSEYAIDRIVPIDYRLYLAPGVRAGSYRWPVALQFSMGAV